MARKFERCECSKMTFAQIKSEAKRMDIHSLKGLKNRLPMGAYCSACAPYVKQMLKTGQTTFDEAIHEY